MAERLSMGMSCLAVGVNADAPASALRAQHGEAGKPRKQVAQHDLHTPFEVPTEDEAKSCRVFAPPQAAATSDRKPEAPKRRTNLIPVRRKRPWTDLNRTTVQESSENDFPT